MFYRPGIDPHGLPHNPFKAIVAPRPIGWIASRDAGGRVNLAPYSFFNGIADDPPMVMFSNTGAKDDREGVKDSVANIRATGEFTHSVVPMALRDPMNLTSGGYGREVDEFDLAGLQKAESRLVAPPFVQGAPAAFECRLWQVVELPGPANVMIIGEVVGVHIDEAFLTDGLFDVTKAQPLSRLGYRDYAAVREVFALSRPGQG